MKQNFEQHVKRDRIKWVIMDIAVLLIVIALVGLCLQLFGADEQKPSEWFVGKCEHEYVDGVCSKCGGEESAEADNSTQMILSDDTDIACVASESKWKEVYSSTREYAAENFVWHPSLKDYPSYEYDDFVYTLELVLNDRNSETQNMFVDFGIFSYGLRDSQFFVFLNGEYICQVPFSRSVTGVTLSFGRTGCNVVLMGGEQEVEGRVLTDTKFFQFLEKSIEKYYPVNQVVPPAPSVHFVESIVLMRNIIRPLPTAPTKEGYTFTGWYLDEDCTQLYSGTTIEEDTVLYAGWQINTYTVTFNSNGGSAVASQTVEWNKSAMLTTPTKTGYNFLGWYLSDGNQYINQPITVDTTLNAEWEIKSYAVTLDSDNGNEPTTQTVNHGEAVMISTPTKTGYIFKGWFLSDGTQYTNQAITSNITLKAKWEIRTFSVAFKSNGGSDIADQVVVYGNSASLPTPDREGYNFLGWFLQSGEEYKEQAITENIILNAKWEIKHFKVAFYVDGELYVEMTVDYGTRLKDVADTAQVFAQNVVSYRFLSADIPAGEFGDMVVVDDMEVEANAPTQDDKIVGTLKNNWLSFLLGGLGFIAVVVGVSAIVVHKRKKR